MSPAGRPWLLALLGLFVLLGACFPDALAGRVALDGAGRLPYLDALYRPEVPRPPDPIPDPSTETLHQPWDAWIVRSMKAGELPLWLPDNGFGAPVLGNGQSAPFSPYKWLTLGFSDGRWTVWFVLGRLALAGAGMLALARALGLGPAAGLLAAAAFMLHAFMLHHLRFPDVHVFAFAPWLLLAAHRLAQAPDARGVGLMGLAIGTTGLLGHPEPALYAAGGAGLAYAAAAWGPRAGRARRAFAMLAAVALGAGIAMAVLMPFAEFVRESRSYLFGERHGTGVTFKHMVVFALSHLLVPEGPRAAYEHFVGIAPLALAALGLAHRAVRPWALAPLALGGFAYVAFPPANLLPAPPLSPNSFYATPLVALGLALLAGAGLEVLMRAPQARRVLALGAGVALAALGVTLYQLLAPFKTLGDLAPALPFLAGLAVVLGLQRRRPWPAPALIGALLLLTALDLGRAAREVVRPLPPFGYPTTPVVRALQAEPGHFRVAGGGLALLPDTNLLHGLASAEHHDAFYFRRYLAFWGALAPRLQETGYQPALLDLANVRFVLVADHPAAAGLRAQVVADPARYPRRFAQPGVVVHENRTALPRARVLHAASFAPLGGPEAEARLAATPDAWRETALLETPDGRAPTGWVDAPGPATPAAIVSYANQRVEVATTLTRPGVLVLADTFAAGWEAEVDGRPAAILPAHVAFRGVLLDPGAHRIVFAYRPRGIRIGLALSLAALALALILLAVRPRAPLGWPPSPPAC